MILIAESGSTKTDWLLVDGGVCVSKVKSAGINPFYQTSVQIQESIELLKDLGSVKEIYFYGAGCANAEKNLIVETALRCYYPDATIEIYSDLLASARAACGREEGIAAIMGTGSNSCHYDGSNIVSSVSPLGYILGDEGSGAVLGKLLIADILKHQAPKEIQDLFFAKYNTTAADIINSVYREPFPNRALAQYTKFMLENIDNDYISDLIISSFTAFFNRNIAQFNSAKSLPINFVGSVAYYFKPQLQIVADRLGYSIGRIIQSPVDGLIEFHSKL